ncbi:GlcG/HbpS family heme-binding protein [Falsiroseomonas sp. E2-1-a4]|uniref:GlcG/HbpS family heme-binding protein n=1 Tax=Falsiroseomonas sp. E2-1-a4 TaxID=3239299 RepID=UPI003F3CE3B1
MSAPHGYYIKHLAVDLHLAVAEHIADATLTAGRQAALLPLTVVVLDAGGHVVVQKREDGSGILRGEIARGKAHGALGMGIGSRIIRDRLKDRPAFQSAIAAASDGRFIPVPGGVLVCREDGAVIGAVGVSGDASDKDEYAAIAGVRAAGLLPHPETPVENWRDAGL